MKEQNIIIRQLEPGLCGDWLHFFDHIAFQDHEDWAFCYCLEGHLDRETNENWTDPGERREKAAELIRKGEMQGYLAYLDDKVIGWCNVNDRKNYRYLTEMFQESGYPTEETADRKCKAIFCFLIAPSYRGRGVAQKLLDRVCRDAARDGYAYVEGYPFADEEFEFQYHGTSKMYERSGFTKAADLNYAKIMRKEVS
ncbi:MAG: GNAT family N-acetyltransferase [bacterium]|nr:GNAT family N-acetyltransferase [bacterium]